MTAEYCTPCADTLRRDGLQSIGMTMHATPCAMCGTRTNGPRYAFAALAPAPARDTQEEDVSTDAHRQAIAQVESIVAMVAALDVDYDQLQELRDERQALQEASDEASEEHDNLRADGDATATELDVTQGALEDAERDLMDWIRDNQGELDDLTAAAGDCESDDDARQRIQDDPLSVEYRSGWATPGADLEPEEFRIVLCTGGPHVEIVGELDEHGEPTSPRVIYKDWDESGELFDFDRDAVTRYCQTIIPS